MARKWLFYVYEVVRDGVLLYVGKGSGKRKMVQARRFGGDATAIAYFYRENDAYAFERQRIAEALPTLNRHPGGNGSRVHPKPKQRQPRWVAEMDRIGTRAYAARLLLSYAIKRTPSEVEKLRVIAFGMIA